MGISYRRLRELIIERKILRKQLKAGTGVSNSVMAKIDKDEHMNTESLEKFARFLGVDIGDLVELKKRS